MVNSRICSSSRIRISFTRKQGTALEIERCAGFFARHLVGFPLAGFIRQRSQIDYWNLHVHGRRDSLEYLAVQCQEGGPKGLVPRHNARHGAAERRSVQISTQPQSRGNVVGGRSRFELFQEPQPLLGQRQPAQTVAGCTMVHQLGEQIALLLRAKVRFGTGR